MDKVQNPGKSEGKAVFVWSQKEKFVGKEWNQVCKVNSNYISRGIFEI
jgi:hypothetical protein